MTDKVVVLGAGYAGAGAVKSFEDELNGDADLTWISETDYHLVLHESHRCIRDPSVQDKITIPVHEIKQPTTSFIQDEVVDIDTDERVVELADNDAVDYDYLLVCLGSQTAFRHRGPREVRPHAQESRRRAGHPRGHPGRRARGHAERPRPGRHRRRGPLWHPDRR